jgi:hypothetical protein
MLPGQFSASAYVKKYTWTPSRLAMMVNARHVDYYMRVNILIENMLINSIPMIMDPVIVFCAMENINTSNNCKDRKYHFVYWCEFLDNFVQRR